MRPSAALWLRRRQAVPAGAQRGAAVKCAVRISATGRGRGKLKREERPGPLHPPYRVLAGANIRKESAAISVHLLVEQLGTDPVDYVLELLTTSRYGAASSVACWPLTMGLLRWGMPRSPGAQRLKGRACLRHPSGPV